MCVALDDSYGTKAIAPVCTESIVWCAPYMRMTYMTDIC